MAGTLRSIIFLALRRFVWNTTTSCGGVNRARRACGQVAFELVHMSTGRSYGWRWGSRMSVGIESLFTSALGLVPPWQVDKVELDIARRRIDF